MNTLSLGTSQQQQQQEKTTNTAQQSHILFPDISRTTEHKPTYDKYFFRFLSICDINGVTPKKLLGFLSAYTSRYNHLQLYPDHGTLRNKCNSYSGIYQNRESRVSQAVARYQRFFKTHTRRRTWFRGLVNVVGSLGFFKRKENLISFH